MKRKLIRQGVDGLTVYLPKKWTEKHMLKPGDEVEILDSDGNLIIYPDFVKRQEKIISIHVDRGRELKRRIAIINAYRAGYDKITLTYDGNIKDIQDTVNGLTIGFEVSKISEKTYSLESVAEPSYEDFDKIIQKMFYILSDILSEIGSDDVLSKVTQIQKYDNLLKRMLSKNMLTAKDPFSSWHLLSIITQIAGQCLYLNRSLKRKFNTREEEIYQAAIGMLNLLQKIYMKKDINLVLKLNDLGHNVIYKKGEVLLNNADSLYTHHLVEICKNLCITSIPLSSIIKNQ